MNLQEFNIVLDLCGATTNRISYILSENSKEFLSVQSNLAYIKNLNVDNSPSSCSSCGQSIQINVFSTKSHNFDSIETVNVKEEVDLIFESEDNLSSNLFEDSGKVENATLNFQPEVLIKVDELLSYTVPPILNSNCSEEIEKDSNKNKKHKRRLSADLIPQTRKKRESYKNELDSYQCADCDQNFPNKRQLLKHLTTVHYSEETGGENESYELEVSLPRDKRQKTFHSPKKIIYSKTEFIPITVQDYEALYHERRKKYKLTPVYEILTLGDCTQLHFMKVTLNIQGKFYMANFDLRLVKCDICEKQFHSISSLLRHRNMHFFDQSCDNLKCLACQTELDDYEMLQRHVCVCREKSRLAQTKCKYCGEEFKSPHAAKTHETRIHKPDKQTQKNQQQVCEICSTLCRDMFTLLTHKRRKHQIDPYICNECGKTCAEKKDVFTHLVKKHYVHLASFHCTACGLPFATESSLKQHYTTAHTDKKVTTCPECNKIVRGNLKVHMQHHRKVEERRKFYCEICSKVFFALSSLEAHKSQHIDSELWPFQCNICNKKQATKYKHTAHMKQHNDKASMSCNVCAKSFTTKQYLKDHMNLHTGEKPYVCKICGKAFADRSCHRSHLKQHEASMGVKLTLNAEERRLQRQGVLNIELPNGLS